MEMEELQWELPDAAWESMVGPYLSSPTSLEQAAVEVDGLLSLTSTSPNACVLDLCCGVGRHTLELAHRALTVTGVDKMASFLDQARERAQDEGLVIEFVHQDMREFKRPDSFDLALNLNTSFGYFEDPEDDLRVLRNIHTSLRPGGRLVLETIGKEVLVRSLQEREWFEVGGFFLLQERRPSADWGRMDLRWIKFDSGQKDEWSVTHRLYAATDLAALMREAGFQRVNTSGDFHGRPYDKTALRLVMVATKE